MIDVTDMFDIERVSNRQNEELLEIARLQGQWTSGKSLQYQAELLGVEGPIMGQFKVHIDRVEARLKALGALKSEAQDDPA